MPAAVELLTILQSHDRLRLLFADLLGTAPRLADTVAQRPHVLDALIDPAFVDPADATRRRSRNRCGRSSATRRSRRFSRPRPRCGAPDALRHRRAAAVRHPLSDAARARPMRPSPSAVVRASFDAVAPELRGRARRRPGRRIAILGLGRLGSRELTAGSDLDLVVIYDFDEDNRESTGPAQARRGGLLHPPDPAPRRGADRADPARAVSTRSICACARKAARARVASQFRGFVQLPASEAELWEHMALTRARVIAGDEPFGATRRRRHRGHPRRAARCRGTSSSRVRAMRELIAQEKGDDDPWDLKLARGGLTDLDFIAQGLVLAHMSRPSWPHRSGGRAGLRDGLRASSHQGARPGHSH